MGVEKGFVVLVLVDQPCSSFTHRENTNKVEFFITQISHDDIENPKCSLNSRKIFSKGKSNHGGFCGIEDPILSERMPEAGTG